MSDDVKIPLPRSLQEIIGSLLFASEVPLTAGDLRSSVKAVEPEEGENAEVMDVYKTCTNREIEEALKGLEKALDVAGCGFKLVCTGGTYRLQPAPRCGRYVRAMLKLDRPNRLWRRWRSSRTVSRSRRARSRRSVVWTCRRTSRR